MARYLPYHRDRTVLMLARAIALAMTGKFEPEYQPETGTSTDPETVRNTAFRKLDSVRDRHRGVIGKYRKKKRESFGTRR
ncbi:MAG: hypothetical protein JW990_07755 [Thermoleophilia bacterium]|nr:hypothetical protein [Thermoleophilia bacterium]